MLTGVAMSKNSTRPWPQILGFTLAISATVFVILDIEFPRIGFIRIDAADLVLV